MTYYWIGPVAIVHMGFTIGVLLAGEKLARVDLRQYIVHILPLVIVAFAIRLTALACWRHPTVRMTPQWRAAVLVYATWPIYTLAWIMAALRLPLRFRLTPKRFDARARWNWMAPQVLASASDRDRHGLRVGGGPDRPHRDPAGLLPPPGRAAARRAVAIHQARCLSACPHEPKVRMIVSVRRILGGGR